ncbi:YqaJ domain-containing protein [Aphis craccivora]|uniref:YqaJ domain-containing protein n=1 Tax=Aphis craccivora TaxID=307492 RepID=A0A6G0Y6D4_APHCR|nr:YqaJ domain-containing protein [Aphis craccivora]
MLLNDNTEPSGRRIVDIENPLNSKNLDVNMVFTTGVINTSQGFTQLQEISSLLNMPCMANILYQK